MDPDHSSPLVDLFLRGGATIDVRMLAARGLLPCPVPEQIALLVVLVDDPDPEIASQADATISRLPRQALADYLATDVPAELRTFFTSRTPAASSGATPGAGSGGFTATVPNGDGATIAEDPVGGGAEVEGDGEDDEEGES